MVTTTDDGNTKEYIGMTANPFKERYPNHKTSFNLYNHSSDTKLSKYSKVEEITASSGPS